MPKKLIRDAKGHHTNLSSPLGPNVVFSRALAPGLFSVLPHWYYWAMNQAVRHSSAGQGSKWVYGNKFRNFTKISQYFGGWRALDSLFKVDFDIL